jgi:hypothetical protein
MKSEEVKEAIVDALRTGKLDIDRYIRSRGDLETRLANFLGYEPHDPDGKLIAFIELEIYGARHSGSLNALRRIAYRNWRLARRWAKKRYNAWVEYHELSI